MTAPKYLSILPELQQALSEAVTRGLLPLKRPEPLTLSDWADKHFYLVAESSSIEGAWETLPYQRAIMNAIGSDDIPIITWRKSARVGYTKMICAALSYNAEHKKRNQVVFQPTDSDAKDFVKDEIDPMLRDIPVLRRMLISDPEKKGQHNTRSKKNFIGSTLDIKGGKSARNYRRMTKDNIFYDELDGFDADIEGEGSPTSIGDMRISTSSFPKSVRGSTPGVMGESLIDSSLDDADMVFRRYLPCPECGEYDYLKWSNIHYTDNQPSTAKLLCESCGALIDYAQYPDMDKLGRWQTVDGDYLSDTERFFNKEHKPIEPPYHIGFILWAAYSYFTTWSELVAEWLAANKAASKGNPNKLKSFVNTRLGESWEEQGSSVNANVFSSRLENYGPDIPEKALVLTAGVDIQADRIELEVMATGHDQETWSIDYNIIPGDTAESPALKNSVWHKLDEYLLTIFTHESGIKLRIASVCIDSGYQTTAVYQYCKARTKRGIYPIKGIPGEGKPVVGRATKGNKEKVNLYPVGVDTAKELFYAHLKVKEHGPSFCHYPAHYGQGEYFDQLTAEKCITKMVAGRPHKVWVLKTAGRRNEPLDCRVYAMAALNILNPNMDRIAEKYKMRLAYEKNNPEQPAQPRKPKRRMMHSGVTL
jgi:phage terminase large subunit GpA-like protein